MVLSSQTLIEQYSGFAYKDFRQAGIQMTTTQWAAFLTDLIPRVEQFMYRYCNVPTFDPASTLNPITEIQNGSGATNYDDATNDYNPQDIVYYLRNLYLDDGTLKVYEDVNDKSKPPAWVLRYARPGAPLAEVDVLTIMSSPTVSGNIAITLNNNFTYYVAVTAGMTIAQVCAAILAAGNQTDGSGILWTVTTDGLAVTFTAGITGPVSLMSVNIGSTMMGYYITQTVQGTNVNGGDYEVDINNELVRVVYYNHIPLRGIRNVKYTYKTGYPATSQQYAELVMISTRACTNFLNWKKEEQAAQAIQVSGVEDIVKLWDGLNEKTLMSNGVGEDLDRYKRFPIEGSMFHDLIYSSAPLGGGI